MSNDPHASYGSHVPVLGQEVISALAPVDGGLYVDATLGGGGYTRMLLSEVTARVYGFDRDPVAIARADAWRAAYAGRLQLISRPFAEMEDALKELGADQVDGIMADLGVSSWQLDEAARGFSFAKDGPLNMRMDGGSLKTGQPNAADFVNHADAKDLADIFYIYGEEKKSRIIARAIVEARHNKPIQTTLELANIIVAAVGQRAHEKIHPATRAFQAIRIFINDELGQLVKALGAAEKLLRPAGRLAVVTFHSLEDRIVKRYFAARSGQVSGGSRHMPVAMEAPAPAFQLLSRKPILPSEDEIAMNSRSRSAKLRVGIRTQATAQDLTDKFTQSIGLPRLTLSLALRSWSL